MRGHVQVRVAELVPRRVTLLTLEGHPLAGAVRFLCEARGSAIRFQVEVYDRPANVIDFIAMRAVGDRLHEHTWSHVVDRVVQISGGSAPNGLEHESASLDEDEAAAIERWCEELAMRAKRVVNAEKWWFLERRRRVAELDSWLVGRLIRALNGTWSQPAWRPPQWGFHAGRSQGRSVH